MRWTVVDFDATVERWRCQKVRSLDPRGGEAVRSLVIWGPEGVRIEIVPRTAN